MNPKPLHPLDLIEDGASPLACRIAALVLATENHVERDALMSVWSLILGVGTPQIEAALQELKRLGYADIEWIN